MATTITVTCPECEKQIKAPPEIVGKKIRCKSCGHTFHAKADAGPDEPAPAEAFKLAPDKEAAKAPAKGKPGPPPEEDEENANPYGVTNLDLTARCPSCANEMESEEAVVCLHCGYNTLTRERARTRKIHDVTGGEQFLWLLPGILCVISVFICIGLAAWIIIGRMVYNPDGEYAKYQLQGATCCTVWWTVLQIWLIYKETRFAINRLILHPKPPEREEEE